MDDIDSLDELIFAVRDEITGGYDVDFNIQPRTEANRASADEFFLVIDVTSTDPRSQVNGQWWFFENNSVMQVL